MDSKYINFQDKLKEECGVFGVHGVNHAASIVYYGLYALQHRGEEGAGIAVFDDKEVYCFKNPGLVGKALKIDNLDDIYGKSAIGHVRYSTSGKYNPQNLQPMVGIFKGHKFALAHNGHIVNYLDIKNDLQTKGIKFTTTSDTEAILRLIESSRENSIEEAILNALEYIQGAYSIVILIGDKLIGIRDSNGIRPLCIGKIGEGYLISSESCSFNSINGEFVMDINPGEMVTIYNNQLKSLKLKGNPIKSTCAFEYIYFAREDSIIDGISVFNSRFNSGVQLFNECPASGDIVIGVPDSGIPAALGYSRASGIPYTIGFAKNKYVGRSFIAPSQKLRDETVSIKLSPLEINIRDKSVILIEDSIVRGTTCRQIIGDLKKRGAREVHLRVASPIIGQGCSLGIDMPSKNEILGYNMDIDKIKEYLKADSLGYLSIIGLFKSIGKDKGFCTKCFKFR